MQPRATRRSAYARWWGVVKKEAKHYWVGGWVGGCASQLPQLSWWMLVGLAAQLAFAR